MIQNGWSLTSPAKASVNFASARPETVDYLQLNVPIVVNCYSPMGDAVVAEVLTKEFWKLVESVVVDVVVKCTGNMAVDMVTRETIRNEVYRIIHLGDPYFWVDREMFKVESPEIVRVAILVKFLSFTLKGTN
jgi:hypothetical protein